MAYCCACTENGTLAKSGVSGTIGAMTDRNPGVVSRVAAATTAAPRLSSRNHRRPGRQRHRLHRLAALGRAGDGALSADPGGITCIVTNELCLHGRRHTAIGGAVAPEGLRISLGGQHGWSACVSSRVPDPHVPPCGGESAE